MSQYSATTDKPLNPNALDGKSLDNGRYEIESKLGSGSMGHVYQAFDLRLETDVVIKVPTLARMEDQRFIHRFLQECRFLVKLSHPNVVKVIDVGEENEIPYVVMQYLAGGTLADKKGGSRGKMVPMTPQEVLEWLPEIAKALDFMHSQKFIHRDVKPENILYDEHGNPYLSDFGLSKVQEEDGGMTAAGAVVGSPNYVAPEIVLARDYDGRADQYSLAITVQETLTGRVPFHGGAPSATLVLQTTQEPPALCDINPDLSVELSKVVLKALSKDPNKRYRNCEEFAEAFQRAAEGVSSSDLNPPSRQPAQKGSSSQIRQRSSQSSRSSSSQIRNSPPKQQRRRQRQSHSGQFDGQALPPRRKGSQSRPHSSGQYSRSSASGTYSRGSSSEVIQFVVTKVSRGQSGRVHCPECESLIRLKFKHAGKRGICKACESRLLISDDLTTLKQIKPARSALGVTSDMQTINIRKGQTDNDMVLSTSLFGVELGIKLAISLGLLLILMVISVTAFTAYQEAQRKIREEQQRQNYIEQSKSIE